MENIESTRFSIFHRPLIHKTGGGGNPPPRSKGNPYRYLELILTLVDHVRSQHGSGALNLDAANAVIHALFGMDDVAAEGLASLKRLDGGDDGGAVR